MCSLTFLYQICNNFGCNVCVTYLHHVLLVALRIFTAVMQGLPPIPLPYKRNNVRTFRYVLESYVLQTEDVIAVA